LQVVDWKGDIVKKNTVSEKDIQKIIEFIEKQGLFKA